MFNQIKHLTAVTFKEFLRNPGIVFWAILFPILMAWGLGIAFTKQDQLIRDVGWIQNPANGSAFEAFREGEDLATVVAGSDAQGKTTYRLVSVSMDEAVQMIKKGQITLIYDESGGAPVYHFDGSNPEAQLAYLHLSKYQEGRADQVSVDAALITPIESRGARYVDFLIPGLIAMNIMMSCMWGISYNLIDKRIKKLLRRMVATPMKKSAFMIAQFIARLGLSGMEVVIIFLFAYAYFGTAIQGSFLSFILLFLAGNVAFTGIAIFASSRTSNSQVGNGLINVVVLPMMILSGIFFSYHNFPDWAITFIKVLPLTTLADSIRSVFNEGAQFVDVVPALGILTATGIVFFAVGIRMYKWY